MPRVGAIFYAEPIGDMVKIVTDPCVLCGNQATLVVSRSGYERWQHGDKIQEALYDLSAADRETLISGTCSECFDKMFPPEDDE